MTIIYYIGCVILTVMAGSIIVGLLENIRRRITLGILFTNAIFGFLLLQIPYWLYQFLCWICDKHPII